MKNKFLFEINIVSLFLLTTFNLNAQDCTSVTWSSIENPGPYEVKKILEVEGLRNGPGYMGATIYYPEDATPPYASIVIVPGFWAPESSVQLWGPYLASHGIVTMTIGTNSGVDLPDVRALALLDAIKTIKEENTREDSPLFGYLDTTKFAVGGWSMGGGGAQLAAVSDTTLKAVMALTPWQYEQLTSAAFDHPVPLLIFSGEKDPTAPPAQHATHHYDSTPEATDKLLFEIKNGNHSVANDPEGGNGAVGKMAVSWLKYFLLGEKCYCPLFLEEPESASKFRTNVICESGTSSIDKFKETEFHPVLFPNPSNTRITVSGELPASVNYEIISVYGSKMSSGVVQQNNRMIDISDLHPNIYILRLGKKNYKIIKIN